MLVSSSNLPSIVSECRAQANTHPHTTCFNRSMTSQRAWWFFFWINPQQDSHFILKDDHFNRLTALKYNLIPFVTRFFGTQCKSTVTLYWLSVYRCISWNDKNPFFRQYFAKYFLHFLIIIIIIILTIILIMMLLVITWENDSSDMTFQIGDTKCFTNEAAIQGKLENKADCCEVCDPFTPGKLSLSSQQQIVGVDIIFLLQETFSLDSGYLHLSLRHRKYIWWFKKHLFHI